MATVTAAEVTAATAFLRELGNVAPGQNLVVAVVAWERQESGGLPNVIGNNPMNIRPGVASSIASGVRTSTRGNGQFLVFPDIATGFRAAAMLLKALAPAYGYGAVVQRAMDNDPVGFLAALALSSWDVGHYGVRWASSSAGGRDNATTDQNALLRVYASFTGLLLPAGTTIVKGKVNVAPAPPTAGVPLLPPAVSPLAGLPGQARPNLPMGMTQPAFAQERYTDASATLVFYRAKHRKR